jgi:acetoin utilization deacetylase AcuC-like enzyme
MIPTALAADPLCLKHDTGAGHPESAARFRAVVRALGDAGLAEKFVALEARDATGAELALAHEPAYLALAEGEIRDGSSSLSTGDTTVSPGSWSAAVRAAGSGLAAVDAVLGGKTVRAFCVMRPPGHHASAARGMGFCIVNHIAIAARHAQRKHGVSRVLIVDWDVHHGNGTQDIFYADGSVFFFSTHQSPWYPGTGRASERGEGAGKGTTLNCPLPAGSGRAEIFAAFEEQLMPAADAFRPELVLISAGFDSRAGDPLGDFRLTDPDFADLTRLVSGIAERHAHGRVISFLEGGYNLAGLASAATAHARALSGME